jgi:hypothetical protein
MDRWLKPSEHRRAASESTIKKGAAPEVLAIQPQVAMPAQACSILKADLLDPFHTPSCDIRTVIHNPHLVSPDGYDDVRLDARLRGSR